MRRKNKKREGRIIRVSHDIEDLLFAHRSGRESFDKTLRRILGLPVRKGDEPERRTYFLIESARKYHVFMDKKEARGAAIQLAIRAGRKKPESVIRTVELP